MISINEANWVRLEPDMAPLQWLQDTMQAFCVFPGTAGTTECFLVTLEGNVYRKRSWSASHRKGPAGEVWFALVHTEQP